MTRIYLDNAATSFPKPESVYAAVDRYQRELGVAVGRGATRMGGEVQRTVRTARKRLAELWGADSPDRIIFTSNGTDSLNLAIHGLLRPGDHVVSSIMEHNSVLRPLAWLQEHRGIEVTFVAADSTGRIEPHDVREAIRPETKLIALTHASNVTGTLQPLADFCEIAQTSGVPLLIDAAQTAGAVPIDLRNTPVDLLACPGHKGLLGPLGTGVLYVKPGIEEKLDSIRQGGTGSVSELASQPDTLPDKYESGNHNAPGLFGLEAGLAFLQDRTIPAIREHEQSLTAKLLDGFRSIDGLRIHGPNDPSRQIGVVSVTADGFDPQILSGILDESFQLQTRAGLHCAPGVHRHLGTIDAGGTVRFSVGPLTTTADIEAAISAMTEIMQTS